MEQQLTKIDPTAAQPAKVPARKPGKYDYVPVSIEDAIRLAEIMANSAMVPDIYKGKPGDILVAMQLGDSIKLTPMQALQSICVINGRPAVWGDGALAIVLASGLMENYKEMTFEEIEKAGKAVFWAKRRGVDEPIVREFSIEDAKRAGLWNNPKKPIWVNYWPRMLQMRARGFGLRDGFADALKGISIADEMQDAIDISATEVREAPKALAIPKRLSDRSTVEVENGRATVTPAAPEHVPERQPAADEPARTEPRCARCQGPLKFVPDGIAKTGKNAGKEYKAFWICETDKYSIKDAAWKEELQRTRFSDYEPPPEAFDREPGQEG